MSEPVLWINDYGDKRWQPRTIDGTRRSQDGWESNGPPALYRSRRRAVRSASAREVYLRHRYHKAEEEEEDDE